VRGCSRLIIHRSALIVYRLAFLMNSTQGRFMATRLFALVVIAVSLACSACSGKADKDYTPPPPAQNVDSPPPGGLQENPGQPRP
jgi:hypothetical protein